MKENKITVSQEIKKHLLTGISWMIPLIVAAGICIALGQVLGGTDVGEKTGTIPWMLNQIGGWGMGLIVPLISAAIAYSIADRPGFAPGLIVGFLCGQIHTGFIGGIDAPRDKCTLSCAINGIHAAFHYLKKNYISGCVMTVPTGW